MAKTQEQRTYSISELSREFDCTPRALRFYEDKGLLSPRRDGLTRVYFQRDRARLKLILWGKTVGLSLIDIKEILDLYQSGADNKNQNKLALQKFRERLAALQEQRKEVEQAIKMINEGIVKVEALAGAGKGKRSVGDRKSLEDAH